MTDGDALYRAIHKDRDETVRLAYADWLMEQGREAQGQAVRSGVVKRFGVDFTSPGGALTLNPSDVGGPIHGATGTFTTTHPDGWTVTGEVRENWYYWVNWFEASHPALGVVFGDFEAVVFATGEAAFRDFWANHEPEAWDYHDI